MDILFAGITIGSIALLGAMSPGPDFAVISKNTLCYGKRAGIYTALGVGSGFFIHIAYTLIGIGLLIARSILLFSVVKYLGALYLAYLGIQLLKTKRETLKSDMVKKIKTRCISKWKAFREGMFANVLNPKVTLFFLSVFTQVVDPSTNLFIRFMYGVETALVVTCWFSIVVLILSHKYTQRFFIRWKWYLEKALGFILVGLSVRLVLASHK